MTCPKCDRETSACHDIPDTEKRCSHDGCHKPPVIRTYHGMPSLIPYCAQHHPLCQKEACP